LKPQIIEVSPYLFYVRRREGETDEVWNEYKAKIVEENASV
jgi:hypothetical protein